MTQSEIVSLQITLPPTIEDVCFSSYENPSAVDIVVNNHNTIDIEVTVKIYVDNYATSVPDAEIIDTIPAEDKKTLNKAVSELNLTSGKHFVYCSF